MCLQWRKSCIVDSHEKHALRKFQFVSFEANITHSVRCLQQTSFFRWEKENGEGFVYIPENRELVFFAKLHSLVGRVSGETLKQDGWTKNNSSSSKQESRATRCYCLFVFIFGEWNFMCYFNVTYSEIRIYGGNTVMWRRFFCVCCSLCVIGAVQCSTISSIPQLIYSCCLALFFTLFDYNFNG